MKRVEPTDDAVQRNDADDGFGRIAAFVTAAVTLAIAALGLWGFLDHISRDPDPSQNIVGQFLAQATDRVTAMLCFGVAAFSTLATASLIVCGLYARRK
jgi:hypothetical protein